MRMQRKVPWWAPLRECVCVIHRCGKSVCMWWSFGNIYAGLRALSRENVERDEMRTNKCRRREAVLSSIPPVGLKRAGDCSPFLAWQLQQISGEAAKGTRGTESKRKIN